MSIVVLRASWKEDTYLKECADMHCIQEPKDYDEHVNQKSGVLARLTHFCMRRDSSDAQLLGGARDLRCAGELKSCASEP